MAVTRVGPMSVADYRRAQARAMTEAQLLAAVWGTPRAPGIARVRGFDGYHTHDSRRSDAGFPDLALVHGPRLLFAELKSHRGRTSAEQDRWLTLLERTGAEVYLWRPADLLDGTIERILRAA